MASESTHSPTAKRNRDPEDAVYLDNLHAHKRYLSEIMASSLNGLKVGESLSENHRTSPSRFDPMDSPARSENMGYCRDDLSSPYSPMSEDSDDSRYYEAPPNNSGADIFSIPTSPVSPQRHHRPLVGFPSTQPANSPSLSCALTNVACSQPRHRGSDSEGRFPSSPSDICHSADLRRAALLRSVQMRANPQGFDGGQESMPHIEEGEDQECLCVNGRGYMSSGRVRNLLLEDCSASMGMSETPQRSQEKYYRALNLSMKGEGGDGNGVSVEGGEEEGYGGNGMERTGSVSSSGRRSALGGHAKACAAP